MTRQEHVNQNLIHHRFLSDRCFQIIFALLLKAASVASVVTEVSPALLHRTDAEFPMNSR